MAIFTNLDLVEVDKHGMFESSRLKATVVGHLYDAIVRDDADKEIEVDNGVAIKVGAYTGDGLQTRFATIAAAGDKIAVTGSPAVVKDGRSKSDEAEYHFYHKEGVVAKAYEVVEEDIFAVAEYQFTSGTPTVGAFVTVDGDGAWAATDVDPTGTNGFVGKVHSIAANEFYKMVRIEVIQNKQI